jgi:hypothetical protein
MDFDRFIENIHWNIVSALNQCNKINELAREPGAVEGVE